MATLPQTKTVTYEAWLTMPEIQDAIEEVVNGEIRIMPPAKFVHALIVQRTYRALDRRLDPNKILALCSSFGDGHYIRAQFLGTGDILKPKLFPHVHLNIAEIWPD